MKRKTLLVLLLLIVFCTVEKVSALPSQPTKDTSESVEHQGLSIRQAIELAYPSALKWNKNAQLLSAINIDLDKPGKSIGRDGKRKYWNIDFGVPETNKDFLVTIHKGKIDSTRDIGGRGASPYPKEDFIRLGDINYDSPQLLKKALELGEIYPGKEWAKGFNFMLRKDTERNINLMLVIGWNSDQTKMKAVGFNATTGEYIKPSL